MDPVTQTPTEPHDYAAISVLYGAALATVVLASRARDASAPDQRELVPLGLATFALSKLVVREKAETWIRAPFVEETPDGDRRPKGRGMRFAVGELLTCSRCLGAWSALGLVALRTTRPAESRVVTTVLATSAANDLLQTGFSWLCAQANAAASETTGS